MAYTPASPATFMDMKECVDPNPNPSALDRFITYETVYTTKFEKSISCACSSHGVFVKLYDVLQYFYSTKWPDRVSDGIFRGFVKYIAMHDRKSLCIIEKNNPPYPVCMYVFSINIHMVTHENLHVQITRNPKGILYVMSELVRFVHYNKPSKCMEKDMELLWDHIKDLYKYWLKNIYISMKEEMDAKIASQEDHLRNLRRLRSEVLHDGAEAFWREFHEEMH
jgi:hypothetical protein